MNEMANKNELKPLDVILIGGDNLIGKVIRKITKCEYSHVGIIIEHLGELYVCEAKAKGFYPTKPVREWFLTHPGRVKVLRAKMEMSKKVGYERLGRLIGNPYEFTNLVVYQLINEYTGKWIGTKGSKKLICSEAIAWVYKEYFDKPYLVTPKIILNSDKFREICGY